MQEIIVEAEGAFQGPVTVSGRQIFRGGWAPSISACGRFVAFHSFFKIFVRDREAGTTERIDVDDHGQGGNGGAYYHSAISGDGRYVAFASSARNLVPKDTNGARDLFVRDRLSGTTTLISVAGAGRRGLVSTYDPGLSADGRYTVLDLFGPGLAPDAPGIPRTESHSSNVSF